MSGESGEPGAGALRRLAPAGLLVLLAAGLFSPALLGGRLFFPLHTETFLPWRTQASAAELAGHRARDNPELSDKLLLLHPDAATAAESWRRGELPAWNPGIACGVPLLGHALAGVLYPPNLLLAAIAPIERAHAINAALHVALAALGAFVLARRLGLPAAAALLAGILFAAGGPMLVRYHYGMTFFAAAWVPWLLAAVHAFTERPSLLRLALVPPPIALIALSGFPQTGLYGIAGAAILGAWRLLAQRGLRGLAPLLALAGAFAAGGALAAAQVLPVDDALARALPRSHGAAQQARDSGTRWMLAGYLAPAPFLDPRERWSQQFERNPLWNAIYCDVERSADGTAAPAGIAARPNATESTVYLGATGLLLALAAFTARWRSPRGALAIALGFALLVCWLYALGDALVVRALALLPRFDVGEVRRILPTAGLLGALLAALGAARLLDPAARGARRAVLALAAALALALAAAAAAVDHAGPEGLARFLHERQVARYGRELVAKFDAIVAMDAGRRAQIHDFVTGRLAGAAGWFTAALLALAVAHRLLARGSARAAAAVLALVATADVATVHFRLNPFVPAERFAAGDPLLAPLASARSGGRIHRYEPGFRMGDDAMERLVLPPNLGECFGIEDVEGYLVAMPERTARFLRALEPEAQPGDTVNAVAALPLRTVAALRSPLLDLLSVRHVLTRRDLLADLAATPVGSDPGAAAADGFVLADQRGEARVYENLEALPFAWVAREAWLLPTAPAGDRIGTAVPLGGGRALTDAQRARLALHESVLRALAAEPGLARRRAYLESDPPGDRLRLWSFDESTVEPPAGGADAPATTLRRLNLRGRLSEVESIERGAARITVRLREGDGGVLLMSDAFDPGWTATIDGSAAPVVPADVAFRGVLLPMGAREVVLEYRPRPIERGIRVSLGALLAWSALVLAGALRRIGQSRAQASARKLAP